MNTKEAAERFHLDINEVRKRKKDGMIIGARTINGRIVIPDNTAIIPSKQDIQSFLLEILRFKNNPHITISRKLCPTSDSLHSVIHYIYLRGFIGEYQFQTNIQDLFDSISLTEDGLEYVIGAGKLNQMKSYNIIPITINPTMNIGLMNIG